MIFIIIPIIYQQYAKLKIKLQSKFILVNLNLSTQKINSYIIYEII